MARTTIRTEDIADSEITSAKILDTGVAAGDLASTLDLSSKTLTIPASAVTAAMVTAHVTAFDDTPVRRDIATLALHTAISDNKAAYNLSNAFIDQFEDDTGVDVETNTTVSDDEYVLSGVAATGNDSNVKLLLNFNGADAATTTTDESATPKTVTLTDGAALDTSIKKFGSASLEMDGSNDHVLMPAHADWERTGDFTWELFAYPTTSGSSETFISHQTHDQNGEIWIYKNSSDLVAVEYRNTGGSSTWRSLSGSHTALAVNTWHHIAMSKDGGTMRLYVNGTQIDSDTADAQHGKQEAAVYLGQRVDDIQHFQGNFDSVRFSHNCRYPNGTAFTPTTSQWGSPTVNATGNFTSATQTATASVSTMGIVVLYKNNEGTASLNTDIVAQVSANGGTNYANATLVAGGTFSTGINIAAVSGVSVTAGTTPKYKISFANQSEGSKETQVYGVALLY